MIILLCIGLKQVSLYCKYVLYTVFTMFEYVLVYDLIVFLEIIIILYFNDWYVYYIFHFIYFIYICKMYLIARAILESFASHLV